MPGDAAGAIVVQPQYRPTRWNKIVIERICTYVERWYALHAAPRPTVFYGRSEYPQLCANGDVPLVQFSGQERVEQRLHCIPSIRYLDPCRPRHTHHT